MTWCFSILLLQGYSQAVDTISIGACYAELLKNYPINAQKALYEESAVIRNRKNNTSWYPQLSVSAQATYQSDVTSIPQIMPFLTAMEFDKDQYKMAVDISQTLWDGGTTKALRNIDRAVTASGIQSVDAELYKVKEQLNKLYFNIMFADKTEAVALSVMESLTEKHRMVESAVRHNVRLQSDADLLKAEILKTEQQIIDIQTGKISAIQMLGELLDTNINPASVFLEPDVQITLNESITRPELTLFDLRIQETEASSQLINARLMPRFNLFGQAGYGKPGLNMLSDEFDFYYIAGARISWNLSAFYNTSHDRELNCIAKDMLKTQREAVEKNIRIGIHKEIGDINKYMLLIEKDNEIIALLENVENTAASQLANGTINAADYIIEINRVKQARLNMELHRLQLLMSKLNYIYAKGMVYNGR